MQKVYNGEHIEGRVFTHDLKIKTVQNQASANFGKEFISGTLDTAVDEAGLNVIQTHFTYVTATTSTGKANSTFSELKRIIDSGKTWIKDGKDEATKVKIDTALAVNDFYTADDQLVSTMQNEGGFVTIVNEICDEIERNTFKTDMVITNVTRVEKDEEKNIPEDYAVVKGVIFNFRNAIFPVEFRVENVDGMKYFEELDASNANPVFTQVWGRINSNTIKVVEESAFGENSVQNFKRKVKKWVITGTKKVPYDFGDEKVLTMEELQKASQDREVYLADVKKRRNEYLASKGSSASAPQVAAPSAPANKGGFTF